MNRAHLHVLHLGGSGGMPPQKFFWVLGPLRWVLVQSELRILLSWSDELGIYSSALHRAFHEACAWPNSKYEDNNEILYHPSIVPGSGTKQVWGGSSLVPRL